MRAVVLTVSDRASAGRLQDESGPAVRRLLDEAGFEVSAIKVLPDVHDLIAQFLATAAVHHQLVVTTDDQIVEVNNGCICCTVRTDLIDAIGRITARADRVDQILIETTGLADPAPVIQSFFLDDQIRRSTRLDAIVTVVDAKHVGLHWDTEETREQIAFADVLLINKTDLVNVDDLAATSARIRRMNPLARVEYTRNCEIALERVLDLRAFDLSRALSIDPQLLEDTLHEHDASVSSVCLRREGTIDDRRLSRWLMELGQRCGRDLYRLKGILNVNDERRRFVVHGVHMLLDGRPGLPWRPGEARMNQLVFIGKALNSDELTQSFEACFKLPAESAPVENRRIVA